jgi:16S rRNA processing protein RimM
MNREECYQLGKITKPHSFKGEVVLWLNVDEPKSYEGLESIWVEELENGRLVPYFIEEMRRHSDRYVVQLEGVTTEEAAKRLAGSSVWYPLEALEDLDDKHFYFHEVAGWKVYDSTTSSLVGEAVMVLDHGPYPLLQVDREGLECLIPLPAHVSIRVDRKAGALYVALPVGLMEIYLNPGTQEDEEGEEDLGY